jgi:hypothetical protein
MSLLELLKKEKYSAFVDEIKSLTEAEYEKQLDEMKKKYMKEEDKEMEDEESDEEDDEDE